MQRKMILYFALFAGAIQILEAKYCSRTVNGVITRCENGEPLPPDLERAETYMLMCIKYGGDNAYAKSQESWQGFGPCMTNILDNDSTRAMSENPSSENIQNYIKSTCAQKNLFKGCVKDLTETTKDCLAPDEHKHVTTFYNVSEQLAEFICLNDGDKIIQLFAQGGQKCIEAKQTDLLGCINAKPGSGLKIIDPLLLLDFFRTLEGNHCKPLSVLQTCVVNVLRGCESPTPANFAESLFDSIWDGTYCKNFDKSSATATYATISTILLAATTILFLED